MCLGMAKSGFSSQKMRKNASWLRKSRQVPQTPWFSENKKITNSGIMPTLSGLFLLFLGFPDKKGLGVSPRYPWFNNKIHQSMATFKNSGIITYNFKHLCRLCFRTIFWGHYSSHFIIIFRLFTVGIFFLFVTVNSPIIHDHCSDICSFFFSFSR